MKKILLTSGIALLAVLYFSFSGGKATKSGGAYVGTQVCAGCHASKASMLASSLHGKIHLAPSATSVKPSWTGSVSMGSSYANASISLAMNGAIYTATLTPTSGSPTTYNIAYTYGGGFKQRYLVKIENSYYILPIQYNLVKYLDNSSGTWATYNPQKWFNTDGTLKAINNSFRKTSYDKNCVGCHVTGNKVVRTVSGSDTAWVATWANGNSDLNMTVGCESCHGRGSLHASTNDPLDIYGSQVLSGEPLARQQEVCGQCHSRSASTAHTYEYPWDEAQDSSYYPGNVLANYYLPWNMYLNVAGGPGVWPDTITSRQHHQQWQDMSYSLHGANQNCYSTCHEPHGNTAFRHQLKDNPDNNALCLTCHSAFTDPLDGTPDITAITTHTKHSYDPTNANQTGGASRCINCHMAATATSANAYDIHSHTWKVVKPSKTLQYQNVTSPTLGMLSSCAVSCHRNPSTANGTANVPTFGIPTDPTLTNWTQPTDIALADTLNHFFGIYSWIPVQTLSTNAGEHALNQNYPNPFQSTTQISFTIPSKELVTIRVYDITGKEVYLLVNETLEKGTHTVNFNVTNIDEVTSNIYFYQIKAGSYQATKKMVCIN